MEADPQQRVNHLLDTLKSFREQQNDDADAAQAAYDELVGMGAARDDIMAAIARPATPPPEAEPEPEQGMWEKAKSAVAAVPAYFSGDETKPKLPDGEQQATAPSAPDADSLFQKFVKGAAGVGSNFAEHLADAMPLVGEVKKIAAGHDKLTAGPVLSPDSQFAKDHPTAFSLANEMIEQPRQLLYGATVRGPRETIKTIEKLPNLAADFPAVKKLLDPIEEPLRKMREYALPEEMDTKNEPQTFGQRVAAGVGQGVTGDLPTIMALTSALGPTGAMAAFSAMKEKEEKPEAGLLDVGTSAAHGALMGKTMSLTHPFTRPVQAGVMGGATAADALVQGAPVDQALEQGLVMAGLAAQGESGKVGVREAIVDPVVEGARSAKQKLNERRAYRDFDNDLQREEMKTLDERRIRFTTPLGVDPYADAYSKFIRQTPEVQKKASAIIDRVQKSGQPDVPVTPEEVQQAVNGAEYTAGLKTQPPKPGYLSPESAQGIHGILGIDSEEHLPLVDLTTVLLRPDIFQYKKTGRSGVTGRLDDATVFDAEAGGNPPVKLYWDAPDRADGQQGTGRLIAGDAHHRTYLAHRLDAHVPVRAEIIDGSKVTPEQARHLFAMSNIRLGSGTAMDAAKLFRGAGMTTEDLRAQGLSLTDKLIGPANALTNLNDALWRRVELGDMKEDVGVMIGRELPDHDAQNALIHLMNQRGKGRTKVSAEWVEEAIRTIQNSPMGQARQSGQMMLGQTGDAFDPKAWGVGAESYALERTNLSTKILEELAEDALTYSAMGKDRIAKRAAELGTPIDQVEAAERGRIGALIEGSYKKLSSYAGPLSDLLNEGARRIRGGEKIAAVQRDIIDAVRKQVFAEAEGRAPGDATSIAGEDIPADTATGDMFGGGAPDEPVIPPDDKTASMFGTDADPAADALPTGDDGAIPPDAPPAVPTWEEPAGQKGWQTWTKERRALSDEDLIAEIERVRAFGGDNPKKGAGRGVRVLEKIASDRGLDVDLMIRSKPREVVPDDAAGVASDEGYSDEPTDPRAGIDMPEHEFDSHRTRAGNLTDEALKKTIDAYARGAALGSPSDTNLLPIYEEELRVRQADRDSYGDAAAWGTEDVEAKPQPAFESAEAAQKFAAFLGRLGDGELRDRAEKWLGMRTTSHDPSILARIDAFEAELKKRGVRSTGAPPPDDAITPGSQATPEERLRARARRATPESLERVIRHDESHAERMPLESKRRAALMVRARIFRGVLAEKMGVEDPVLIGDSKVASKKARMIEKAREMSTQELVDWMARDDTHSEWRGVYEHVLKERAAGGETPPQPSTDKKQRSTTEKGGKKKRRKSTDPEQMGRLGGIDPEDEPVGPSAYARRDGVVEQEDNGPGGIKAAPGLDAEIETPTGIPDDLPPRTAPPEASEVPVGRIGIRSIFGLRRPTTAAGVDELVRRSDIVRALAEKLKVPIRQGRISMKRALGIYKVRPEVIRAQIMKDIETVAHEIGHHIDKRVFSNPPSGPMGGPPWNRQPENFGVPVTGRMGGLRGSVFNAFAPELHRLASPGNPGSEGFAEFVRLYVAHPARAAREAPNFYRFFEQNVQRRAPEVLEALLDARRDYERYMRQPATQQILSNISIGEHHDKPAGQRGWYHNIVEDIRPLKDFRDAVAGPNQRDWKFKENEWSNLDAMDDPYILTRLLAGWVPKADAFIGKGTKGALDYATLQRVTRPLEEWLEGVRDFNDFRVYMVARRTVEVQTRPMGKRMETGVTLAQARRSMHEIEQRDPNVRRAFDGVREVQDAALKYLSDSGMVPREMYTRLRAAGHDFVPLHRVMEDDVEAGFQRRTRATNEKEVVDLQSPIYRMKGSHRDIIDPLESIVKNIYTYVYLAERNKVGQAMVQLARRMHGSGFGVEEIGPDQVPAAMLRPEELPDIVMREFKTALQALNDPSGNPTPDMIDRARRAMEGHGFSMAEVAQLEADIQQAPQGAVRGKLIKDTIEDVRNNLQIATPDGLTPIFRPGINKNGEPIVSVRFQPTTTNPSGLVYLRLSPELFQVVKGLDAESANVVVKFLAPFASTLRAGVVLSPEFGFPNLIRDQMTAGLQSRNGFIPIYDTIKGLCHLIGNTELAKDFYISGGAMAELTSMDRRYLQRSIQESIHRSGGQLTAQDMKKMNPLDRWRAQMMNAGNRMGIPSRGTFYLSHPIEALRLLTEYSENATRLGEYARGMRNAERAGVTSRREAMARSGYAAREVTIDFARAGAWARQINKISAFWNVAIQGPDRLLAAAKRDPVGFNIRAILGITLPSALLWAINYGDPRVDELDDRTKDLHFVFPSGTVTRDQWKAMTDKEKAEYSLQHPIYLLPKPYEAGLLFGSLTERALDYFIKKDPKAMRAWIGSVYETTVPGILPTAAGPIYEAATNYSNFRGSSLVPRSLEDVEAFEQRTNYTSPLAISIARATNMIPMPEIMGKTYGLQSPIKIENYIRGYLGGSGRIVTDLASAIIEPAKEGIDPETTLADRFMWRRFVRRFPSSQSKAIEEFYDIYQHALEADATKELYEKKGDDAGVDRLYAERGEDLYLLKGLQGTAKQLSMARAAADEVRNDKRMSPRERRVAIDAISFEMMGLAREAVDDAQEVIREEQRKRKGLPPETEQMEIAPPLPGPPGEGTRVVLEPPKLKRKPYDPPDVSDALKRGELKPNEMADFADHHRKQAQGGR